MFMRGGRHVINQVKEGNRLVKRASHQYLKDTTEAEVEVILVADLGASIASLVSFTDVVKVRDTVKSVADTRLYRLSSSNSPCHGEVVRFDERLGTFMVAMLFVHPPSVYRQSP